MVPRAWDWGGDGMSDKMQALGMVLASIVLITMILAMHSCDVNNSLVKIMLGNARFELDFLEQQRVEREGEDQE